MEKALIAACESFSLGKGELAFAQIAEDVQWHIIGDHTVLGLEAIRQECEAAAKEGLPNFENHRTIEGQSCVVVEGSDIEADIHYCDIYTIADGKIAEIASYCMTAATEEPE